MPAVFIRQLQNIEKISRYVTSAERREILLRHSEMILRASDESVAEPNDRRDVHDAYDRVLAAQDRVPGGR